jgi:hypothetical protein
VYAYEVKVLHVNLYEGKIRSADRLMLELCAYIICIKPFVYIRTRELCGGHSDLGFSLADEKGLAM